MLIHECITDPESWKPARFIEKKFVKYAVFEKSDAEYLRSIRSERDVKLTVIVPTVDASRGGYFEKLFDQIHRQRFQEFELIVVRGDSRQGRAINIGAALAKGKYLLTLDDDTSLPDVETFQKMVDVMEKYPTIGIAGGNNTIPDEAPSFVRRVMKEIPRRSWEPVDAIMDSDLAEHPCMLMRTEEFKAVGGENELIPRGLDPYLREQFRLAGKRVVVVPGVQYHHLPPANMAGLWRQFYRNGFQASYTRRHYPQWIIETPAEHGSFKVRKPFLFRALRFPLRLLSAAIAGKFIWLLSELAYALGFVNEVLSNGIFNGRKNKRG